MPTADGAMAAGSRWKTLTLSEWAEVQRGVVGLLKFRDRPARVGCMDSSAVLSIALLSCNGCL